MQKRTTINSKNEVKATFFYFISNICTRAFGFLTIPLYTHMLTTSEYGYLNTYSAWVSVLSVILGLSLSGAIYGHVKLNKKEINKFQSSVFSLSFVSAILISLVVIGAYLILKGRIDAILILALVQGYGTFTVNFFLQELILDNRYILHSIISILTVVIPVGITCVIIKALFQTSKYLCVIVPRAIIYGILLLVFAIIILVRGKKYFDIDIWKWSLRYCLPLVFHTLSLTILLQADRIMLSSLYSLSESGIYSFIYNITLVVGVLIGALENTWKTWFFNKYDTTDKYTIQKRVRLFVSVAILGVAVYVFVAPDLIRILASKEYQTQTYLIGPIALAYIISFLYDFPVYLEYKKNATKYIAISSVIAASVNIILNFILIPIWGGIGAALTTLVSYLIQFVLHTIISNKLEKNLFTFRLFIPYCIMGIIILVVFIIVMNTYMLRYIMAVGAVLLLFIQIYKNKELLV